MRHGSDLWQITGCIFSTANEGRRLVFHWTVMRHLNVSLVQKNVECRLIVRIWNELFAGQESAWTQKAQKIRLRLCVTKRSWPLRWKIIRTYLNRSRSLTLLLIQFSTAKLTMNRISIMPFLQAAGTSLRGQFFFCLQLMHFSRDNAGGNRYNSITKNHDERC